MVNRELSWMKGWLEKQKTYSPQPYENLAAALRRAGSADKAIDVLYSSKDRELSESTGLYRWWLTGAKVFIAYGLGYRMLLQASKWVVFLVLLGMLFTLMFKDELDLENQFSGFTSSLHYILSIGFYSLEVTLPFLKLDKRHEDMIQQPWLRYWFYVQRIMGYLVAIFLLGGLSGLIAK